MRKLYLLLFLLMPLASGAQELAVKTNALYWVTAAPNIGLEVGLGKMVTFNVEAICSPFKLKNDLYFKHWSVNPEFRFWLSEKFYGHFFGIGALYSNYNVSGIPYPTFSDARDHRYDGWSIAASITYGYQWPIAKRWNMEASVGIGYAYTKYDKYERGNCGEFLDNHSRWVPVPTKASLSFIYLIR